MPELRLAPTDRVLIFAPHPDDETIATGGVIQQAVAMDLPTRVVYLTYGDNAETAFIAYRKRPVVRGRSVQGMGLTRHDEAVAANGILGLSPGQLTFLGYPDFRTLKIWSEHWGENAVPCESMFTRTSSVPYANAFRPGAPYRADEILADVKTIIRNFRPTVIFTAHPGDHNPDHLSLYLFTRIALWDLAGELQPVVWPFLVHHPEWPQPEGYHPELGLRPPERLVADVDWHTLPLDLATIETKRRAVQAHVTQLTFDRQYLDSFMRGNELFGGLDVADLRAHAGDTPLADIGAQPVISPQLTHDERLKFVGVERRSIRLDGDRFSVSVTFSRPVAESVTADIYMFGYRPDVPFAQMPKLRLRLTEANYALFDQSTRLLKPPITVQQNSRSLAFSLPVSALGDPQYVLASARTSLGKVPLDWIAWRTIRLRD
jgi:LmbE family N-acetylglucosaminyl deacetylase